MNGRKIQAGFTLIEIVIAVVFFSLIAVGVGQALLSGQKASIELRNDATVLASCEDLMRQMSSMTISDIANQNGNSFTVGGVNGSGTINVETNYLGSADIVNVLLSWGDRQILERAFGNAAMIASGGESGGGGEGGGEEPQWYDQSHVLTSPNYPNNYSHNYDHTWTITEPGAQKMKVHFSSFNTRHSYDMVYIKNGSGSTVASYYGNKGSFTSAEVNGDTIKIRFKTNSWGRRKGWKIDKYQYYK
jgi:prepilin-type N-terminal cleavage/methylation domain-containing protein